MELQDGNSAPKGSTKYSDSDVLYYNKLTSELPDLKIAPVTTPDEIDDNNFSFLQYKKVKSIFPDMPDVASPTAITPEYMAAAIKANESSNFNNLFERVKDDPYIVKQGYKPKKWNDAVSEDEKYTLEHKFAYNTKQEFTKLGEAVGIKYTDVSPDKVNPNDVLSTINYDAINKIENKIVENNNKETLTQYNTAVTELNDPSLTIANSIDEVDPKKLSYVQYKKQRQSIPELPDVASPEDITPEHMAKLQVAMAAKTWNSIFEQVKDNPEVIALGYKPKKYDDVVSPKEEEFLEETLKNKLNKKYADNAKSLGMKFTPVEKLWDFNSGITDPIDNAINKKNSDEWLANTNKLAKQYGIAPFKSVEDYDQTHVAKWDAYNTKQLKKNNSTIAELNSKLPVKERFPIVKTNEEYQFIFPKLKAAAAKVQAAEVKKFEAKQVKEASSYVEKYNLSTNSNYTLPKTKGEAKLVLEKIKKEIKYKKSLEWTTETTPYEVTVAENKNGFYAESGRGNNVVVPKEMATKETRQLAAKKYQESLIARVQKKIDALNKTPEAKEVYKNLQALDNRFAAIPTPDKNLNKIVKTGQVYTVTTTDVPSLRTAPSPKEMATIAQDDKLRSKQYSDILQKQYSDVNIAFEALNKNAQNFKISSDALKEKINKEGYTKENKSALNALDEQQKILMSQNDVLSEMGTLNKIFAGNIFESKAKIGTFAGAAWNNFVVGGEELLIGAYSVDKTIGFGNPLMPFFGDKFIYKTIKGIFQGDEVVKNIDEQQKKDINEFSEKLKSLSSGIKANVSDEYMQKKSEDGSVASVLMQLPRTIPAMAIAIAQPEIGFAMFALQDFGSRFPDAMNNPKNANLTMNQLVATTLPISIVNGVIEDISMKSLGKSMEFLSLTKKAGSKIAAKELLSAKVYSNFLQEGVDATGLTKYVSTKAIKVAGALLEQANTEAFENLTQEIATNINNSIANRLLKTNSFQVNNDANTYWKSLKSGWIGGFAFGSIATAGYTIANNIKVESINNKQFELVRQALQDPAIMKSWVTDIKLKIANKEITLDEGKAYLAGIKEFGYIASKIPTDISVANQKKSFDLIKERMAIEQEVKGKDENLTLKKKQRITEINKQLQAISLETVAAVDNGQVVTTNADGTVTTTPAKTIDGVGTYEFEGKLYVEDKDGNIKLEDGTSVTDQKTIDKIKKEGIFNEIVPTADIEAKKADIERRRQEENTRFPSGQTTFKKINPDGENTEVTDKQKATIERVIDGNIKDGKTPSQIVETLNTAGYTVLFGNETTTLMNYLEDRIAGAITTPFFEFNNKLRDKINAKYDAELAALETTATTTKTTPTAAQKVETLRAAEQAELDEKIPNAEQYRVDGKVDRTKLTNDADIKAFDEVYKKYDKLITDVSKKETPKVGSVGVGGKVKGKLENEGFKPTLKPNGENEFILQVDDTKPNGKRSVGVIGLKTVEVGGKKFLSIGMTSVREGYEGKGLATNMYRYLMENLPEGYDGILSPKETRWNNEQIPKIHEKLSKEYDKTELDNGDIVFKNKAVEQSIKETPKTSTVFGNLPVGIKASEGAPTSKVHAPLFTAAKTALKVLNKLFPNTEIHFHENNSDFQKVLDATANGKEASKTDGNFAYIKDSNGKYTVRIDINLANPKASVTTVIHEAGHPILLSAFGENPDYFKYLKSQVAKSVGFTKNAKLKEFIKAYDDVEQPEEYLVQLGGILKEGEKIEPNVFRRIAEAINKIFLKITDGKFKPFENVKNSNDAVRYFASLVDAIRTGDLGDIKLSSQSQKSGATEMGSKQSRGGLTATDMKSMTVADNGDLLFFHYGDIKGSKVDARKGTPKAYTTDKRVYTANYYYTNESDREGMVGGKVNVVRVPADKVYNFNKDVLGLFDEAKKNSEAHSKGQAFSPNRQADFIAQLASKNGFDMVVAKWGNGYRAESPKALSIDAALTKQMRTNGSLSTAAVDDKLNQDIYNAAASKANGNSEKYRSTFYGIKDITAKDIMEHPILSRGVPKKLADKYNAGQIKSKQSTSGVDIENINNIGVSGVINSNGIKSKSSISSGVVKRFPVNKNVKVQEDVPMANFNGKVSNLIESDRMTGGWIGDENGNVLYRFYGGVFYPIITGKWWASRNERKAKAIANNGNKNRDADGYVYCTPMIGSNKQHMSNIDMLSVTVELMKSDVIDKKSMVRKEDVVTSIDKAFNRKSLKNKRSVLRDVLKKSNNIGQIFDELEYVLFQDGTKVLGRDGNPMLDEYGKPLSNFSFKERLAIVNTILGDPKVKDVRFPSAGSITDAAKRFEEPITAKSKTIGDAVTVMRTKGTLMYKKTDKTDKFYHKSYPVEIYAVDENGNPAEIEVYVLDGAYGMMNTFPSLTQSSGKVFTYVDYAAKHKSETFAIAQYNRTAKMSSAAGEISAGIKSKQSLNAGDKVKIEGVSVTIPSEAQQDLLKQERTAKSYFDEKVRLMKPSPLSKEEIKSILDRDDTAILTGTNPDGNAVDDKTNKLLNKKAEDWLKENGYTYHQVTGKYGQTESSFLVEGMTGDVALEFAKIFKQDSVLQSEGLIYREGTIEKRIADADVFGVDVAEPEADYVSAIKTNTGEVVGFQIGLDLGNKVQYEVESKQSRSNEDNLISTNIFIGRDNSISEISDSYKRKNNLSTNTPNMTFAVSDKDGKRIADAYDQMKHSPNDPSVKKGFADLITQIKSQADALMSKGYKFQIANEGEGYNSNSKAMVDDVRKTKRIFIDPSSKSFGTDRTFDKENIGLQDSGYKDVNGIPMTNVELIRGVHDLFGHNEFGNGFGATGEENAWRNHMSMFTGLAQKALTATTRGQNSWVNFGKHMRNSDGSIKKKGDKGYLSANERPFAEQKIGFLPDWATENSYGDVVTIEGKSVKPVNKYVVEGSEVYEIDDASSFYTAMKNAKESDTLAGIQVELKPVEKIQEIIDKGGRLLITKDGKVGMMVYADGNAGGGFKNTSAEGKNLLKPLLLTSIKLGARYADAYDTFLPEYYSKFGFKPYKRIKFNPEYAEAGWENTILKSKPDIVVLYWDGGSRENIGKNYGKFPEYNKSDGEYTDDYEGAIKEARNISIAKEPTASLIPSKEVIKSKQSRTEDAKSEYENKLESNLEDLRSAYSGARKADAGLRKITDESPKNVRDFVKRILNGTTPEAVAEAKAKLVEMQRKYRKEKAEMRAMLPRERGVNFVIEKLSRAARNGDITQDEADLAIDLLRKSPSLFGDLAISITSGNKKANGDGVQGWYRAADELIKIFKNPKDPLTVIHELLHHTERFLPQEVRDGIIKEWHAQVQRQAADIASKLKTETDTDTRQQLTQALLYLGLAEARQLEPDFFNAMAMENIMKKYLADHTDSKGNFNKGLGDSWYQLYNPSEWWAVNASKIFRDAKNKPALKTWTDKAKAFYNYLIDSIKKVFKGNPIANVEKGLKAILEGNTLENMEGNMLADSKQSLNIKQKESFEERNQIKSKQSKTNNALKDVESTAKALEGLDKSKIEEIYAGQLADNLSDEQFPSYEEYLSSWNTLNKERGFDNKLLSEAYHNAKADDSNPELVKAVEELLSDKSKVYRILNDTFNQEAKKTKIDKLDVKALARKVVDIVKSSKLYEQTDDIERENAIIDFLKTKGIVQKRVIEPRNKNIISVNEVTALKDQIRLEIKAANDGAKSIEDAVKKIGEIIQGLAKGKKISITSAKALIKKFSNMNTANKDSVNSVLDYASKIFNDAEYADKVSQVRALNAAMKRAARNSAIPPATRSIALSFAKINPEAVSDIDAHLEAANKIKDATLGVKENGERIRKAIDINAMADYLNRAMAEQETYDAKNPTTTRVVEPLDEEKTLEYLAAMHDSLLQAAKAVAPSAVLTDAEMAQLKNFLKLSIDDFETMAEKIAAVEALDHFVKNADIGKIPFLLNNQQVKSNINKGVEVILPKLESVSLMWFSEQKAKIRGWVYNKFMYGNAIDYNKELAYFMNQAIRRIDSLIGNFKTYDVFNKTFKAMASGYAKYIFKIKSMEANVIFQKVLASFYGDMEQAVKHCYKMTMYKLQLEYESNIGNIEVIPAIKHLNETLKSGNLTEKDKDELRKLIDKFSTIDATTGEQNIDTNKIWDSFSEVEQQAAISLAKLYEKLRPYAQHVAVSLRGEVFNPRVNYMMLNVISAGQPLSTLPPSASQVLTDRGSTKAQTINPRDGKPHPISLDPYNTFNTANRDIMMDYCLLNPIKTVEAIFEKLVEDTAGDKKANDVAKSLKLIFDEITQSVINRSIVNSDEISAGIISYIKKVGARFMLSRPSKAVGEFSGNLSYAITRYGENIIEGMKNNSLQRNFKLTTVMEVLNSYSLDRLYPHKGESGAFLDPNSFDIDVRDKKHFIDGFSNAAQIAYYNSLLWAQKGGESISDALMSVPDLSIGRFAWEGTFRLTFKKETGLDIDMDKIEAKDYDYLEEYKDALEKATTEADRVVAEIANTKNPFVGIAKEAAWRGKMSEILIINNYMTSFTKTENQNGIDAAYAVAYGGKVSRIEGIRTIAAILVRSGVYNVVKYKAQLALLAIGYGLINAATGGSDSEEKRRRRARGILKYNTVENPKIQGSITGIKDAITMGNAIQTYDSAWIKKANQYVAPEESASHSFIKGMAQAGAGIILGRSSGGFYNSLVTAPLVEYANEKYIHPAISSEPYNKYRDGIMYSKVYDPNRPDPELNFIVDNSGAFQPFMRASISAVRTFYDRYGGELAKVEKKIEDHERGVLMSREDASRAKYDELVKRRDALKEKEKSMKSMTLKNIIVGVGTATSILPAGKDIDFVADKIIKDESVPKDWNEIVEKFKESRNYDEGTMQRRNRNYKDMILPEVFQKHVSQGYPIPAKKP